jgi:enoyl-CoA hydratase/carnithine racemase
LTNPLSGLEVWSPPGIDAAGSGLRLERAGAVVQITLDRPERRNAQRPETWHTLDAIGRALPGDVRIVVVTGAGPSFSAGIDLAVLGEMASNGLAGVPDEDTIAGYQAGFTWLSRPDLVSVAAVAGHAVGAGFQLALACDLRVLAEDAQFTMAETSRGLVPDLTGTEALVHHIGYARALEVCLTGRRIGATEAHALGLANVVVPRDQLETATADLVAALLAAPRESSIETKALLLRARGTESERAGQHEAERAAQVRLMRGLAGG